VASIVFHAGMPKAGSTTIQDWLAANLALLAEHCISCVRIMQAKPDDPIELRAATPTSAISQFVANDVDSRPDVGRRICDLLAEAAESVDTLVVSNESYEVLFNAADRHASLAPFDELATTHELRVAYYVRPQHAWLESAWLQWGFRNPTPPDGWIRRQRQRIDYFATLCTVRDAAPHLSFELRPFRADLLDGGHVVNDFARVFLGIEGMNAETTRDSWSNRSLPMDAAVMLRNAPTGMFWENQNHNATFYPLKRLILQWDLPASDVVPRARSVLQRYANAAFEPGNKELIRELGWNTDHFVPPVGESSDRVDEAEVDLGELNSLWRSGASDAEQHLFFAALRQALAGSAS
jgi:hypothetical protein